MSDLPTEHCSECEPDEPCDGAHVYVIELGLGIEEKYRWKHRKHLYVGETGNTVDRRMQSNLTRADKKTVVSLEEARKDAYGKDWMFKGTGIKKIRAHYVRHRPDLYAHLNPITDDEDERRIAQRKLTRKFEKMKENGRRKYHVHGDGKKKRRRKKKRRK